MTEGGLSERLRKLVGKFRSLMVLYFGSVVAVPPGRLVGCQLLVEVGPVVARKVVVRTQVKLRTG